MEIMLLLQKAVKAALKAGQEILDVYGSKDFAVETKDDQSPLTLADTKAHNAIMHELNTGNNIPVLSEEGKNIPYNERRHWKHFWLVDPLDGTKEFIKRNDEFTVNIALIHNAVPVAGVIYVPVLRQLYVGEIGTGAYLIEDIDLNNAGNKLLAEIIAEGKRLPISNSRTIFTVVGSRSHMNDTTKAYMEKIGKEKGEMNVFSRGSSLKLCMVAEGKADVYPRFAPTMEWDTAAGHAIVLASGGTVTEQDETTPLKYNKKELLNPWFIVKRNS